MRQLRAFHILILVLLTLLAFGSTISHGFLYWDDQDLVVGNPLLHALSWENLHIIWSQPIIGLYTPMAYSVWAIVAAISRGTFGHLDPRLFHALNLALHCLNAGLVYAILVRLTKHSWASLAGAAVWAVHPIQVEAVAWISGFNNLLAGSFGLAAIVVFLRGIESPRIAIRSLLYLISTFLFVLALFSKPTAVVIPLIALVLVIPRWRAMLVLITWLLLAIAFMVITTMVQPASDVFSPSLFGRIFVAADAVGFYLVKVFVPWHLHVDYGRSPQWVLKHPGVYPLAFALALGLATAKQSVRPGLGIFIVALLPVLGLRAFDFQKYSTVADRYVYLAMLGVAVVVAKGLSKPSAVRAPRLQLVVCAIVFIFSLLTFRQASLWRDERTLFDYDIALNPRSAAAHIDLGFIDGREGKIATAAEHYAAAVAILGPDAKAEYQWGNLLLNKAKDPLAAIDHYRTSLRLKENDPKVHNNLGIALYKVGDQADAKREFERALEIDPDYADPKKNLRLMPND